MNLFSLNVEKNEFGRIIDCNISGHDIIILLEIFHNFNVSIRFLPGYLNMI